MPIKVHVKSVLNKHKRRDSWFLDDYSINMYSGCSFNCQFCYIRGSKFGIHMEQKLGIKENALEVLDRQLFNRARKEEYGIIAVSSATDPYLQFEEEYQLTRQALQLILKYRFPVHILTRSDLVIRDFDLLKRIDAQAFVPRDLEKQLSRGVILSFSFSTLDEEVRAIFEPGATPIPNRLETLKEAKKNGFLTGISMMPLLPWISDTSVSLEAMFTLWKEIGIDYVFPATLTLFGSGTADSKALVFRAIQQHYPNLIGKYEKYFSGSTEMPAYYVRAFEKKMQELLKKHGLVNDILKAPNRFKDQIN